VGYGGGGRGCVDCICVIVNNTLYRSDIEGYQIISFRFGLVFFNISLYSRYIVLQLCSNILQTSRTTLSKKVSSLSSPLLVGWLFTYFLIVLQCCISATVSPSLQQYPYFSVMLNIFSVSCSKPLSVSLT
jgi:hypothetical protein